MNRRDAILAFIGLAIGSQASNAQQPRKVWRIGVLTDDDTISPPNQYREVPPIIKRMRELGYVEDRDYVMEYRFADHNIVRLPVLAAELVALRVDLIISIGTPSSIAARDATREIPIVFTVGDPVGVGLVKNLGRPGGNLTGNSSQSEVTPKLLDLLRQLVPRMSRVGFLHDSENPSAVLTKTRLESACKELGMRLIPATMSRSDEMDKAFVDLKREKAQGLVVSYTGIVGAARQRIIESAANYRLPSISYDDLYAESGGLISYSPNEDSVLSLADYLDKIIKGAKPGDLPIAQPTTFDLIINLKTAKALGLTIPQSLLIGAKRLIE